MNPGGLLLAAAAGMLVSLLAARSAPRVWLAATLAGLAAAGGAAVGVLGGWAPGGDWPELGRLGGEALHLRCDGVSAFFLLLLAVVGGAGAVFGHGYWPEAAHPRSAPAGRAWWSALLVGCGAVLLAANGLHFLLAWELFTVSAFFLITLDARRAAVRAAGWLYLGTSHAATLALFAFFALLAGRTGSWELGPQPGRPELAPLFWLALFGFGLKAGAFPLHVWLPSAHANAPSHVSAILSGVTIKLGIYGLVRFSGWLPLPVGADWVVVALGGLSAVLGVGFALGQHDLKRLLAYHSVENIGIILLGLGFGLVAARRGEPAWGVLALAGGLLHVWNHGLFKALLFLGAGAVLHATGTREMSRLGGLWRAMPWTTGLFALGAVAIVGLPPLNGFVSEWLVYLGLFGAAVAPGPVAGVALPAILLLGVTGALALACFAKVGGVVFLGAPRSRAAERALEAGPAMRGAMLGLAGLCTAIGLAPALVWPALARVIAAWRPAWAGAGGSAPLVTLGWLQVAVVVAGGGAAWGLVRRLRAGAARRAPTWDCGYAQPTARMQFTAGSFAGTLTEWFAWILRPERHEEPLGTPFPLRGHRTERTPETVLERVVTPAGRAVLRVATAVRRLQHGRVQSYLLYLLLGVAGLAVVVWAGGGR